jgi:hypothetical protein
MADRRRGIGQGRHGGHGRFVAVARRGHGHQPVGRAVAGLRIGITVGHSPSTTVSVVRGMRGPAHPGVRVGFGKDGELCRILQLADRLQSNGGVGVLPAGCRLELVQESHGRNGCVRKIRAATWGGLMQVLLSDDGWAILMYQQVTVAVRTGLTACRGFRPVL